MAQYRDSVGNVYRSVPPPKHPPGAGKSRNGNKKHGRKARQPAFQRWKARHPLTRND